MEIKKTRKKDAITWTVIFENLPQENLSDTVNGSLIIDTSEILDYPIDIEFLLSDCDYIDLKPDSKTIDNPSEKPVELEISLLEKENDSGWAEPKISYTTGSDNSGSADFPIKSAEVVNICSQILSESYTSEEILQNADDFYALHGGDIYYSNLRKHARQCTGFKQYISILSFLYDHKNNKDSIKQDLFNTLENRVIGGEYQPDSMQEFEEKIEIISDQPPFPDLSSESKVHELRAELREIFAENAVEKGEFQEAKEQISKAIDHYEVAGKSEASEPVVLKNHAIDGIIDESNSDFKKASESYSVAAEEAETEEDTQIYKTWKKLAEIKHFLVNDQFDEAQQSVEQLPVTFEDVDLVDLRKLRILIDLIDSYQNGKHADAKDTFNRADVPYVQQNVVLQYEVDYSTAYSMLLTRQRLRQLDNEPKDRESLLIAIKDAITPKGIEGNDDSNRESESDKTSQGSIKSSNHEVELNSSRSAQNRKSSSTNNTNHDPTNETKLRKLRKRAEEAATENPVKDTSTTSSRYQRAPEIKEYAKARAEGYCEYCEQFAPFNTPDGEPYLEVHHVDELGEGGEDHPNKVVALCPNCHREIHNGVHGDKINNELREKLEELSSMGVTG